MTSPLPALHYPFAESPAPGAWTTVAPGIHWVRMPLPFALDHINLWVLDDEIDGVVGYSVVDCGASTPETQAAWRSLFAGPMGGRPILRVIATHFHPDHLGLAYWLCAGADQGAWTAPLCMSAGEYATGRYLAQQTGEAARAAGERVADFYASQGYADAERLAALRARGAGHFTRLVPAVPTRYHRLFGEGQITIGLEGAKRVFRLMVGYGHSVEHLSLFAEDDAVLISGDMVLPRISTNVSVFEVDPEADPLPLYLRSIDQTLMLPAATLVLPSHGLPFTGLHTRVAQQHAHHAARLEEVAAACGEPRCAAEIVPVLFRRELDAHQLGFALGEAVAHLNALWHEGRLSRRLGEDGVYRYCLK